MISTQHNPVFSGLVTCGLTQLTLLIWVDARVDRNFALTNLNLIVEKINYLDYHLRLDV